jgi:predicted glutamine amidotransferase
LNCYDLPSLCLLSGQFTRCVHFYWLPVYLGCPFLINIQKQTSFWNTHSTWTRARLVLHNGHIKCITEIYKNNPASEIPTENKSFREWLVDYQNLNLKLLSLNCYDLPSLYLLSGQFTRCIHQSKNLFFLQMSKKDKQLYYYVI